MRQKVSILVHPYFFAYHTHHLNGETRYAKKECGRLGQRYREGIKYAQDGHFVFLQATEGYEYEEKLVRYAQAQFPHERICIASSKKVADTFLVEIVKNSDDVFVFGEDIAACVMETALKYHTLLGLRNQVTIIGNYCGKNVPNLESAWQQIQEFNVDRKRMRNKVKVTWFENP